MKLSLLILCSFLFTLYSIAQQKSDNYQTDECFSAPKNFSSSGKATVGYDFTTNAYYGQNSNLSRYYLIAQPQIKIGALPFTTTLMLTSENGAYTQNLSSFGIRFDAKEYSGYLKQKMLCKLQDDNSYQKSMNRSREMNKKLDSINIQTDNLKNEQEGITARSTQLQSWKDSGYKLSYEQMYEMQSLQQRQSDIEGQLGELQKQKDALSTVVNKLNSQNNFSNPTQAQIETELKNRSSINGAEKFFLNTEQLGIGTVTLNHSELMLYGAVVEGGEFAYSPNGFSAGFAGGKTRFLSNQIFPQGSNSIPAFNYRPFLKDAYFTTGHFGIGRTDEAHLHCRYVHIIDNGDSQKPTAANDLIGASFLIPVKKYIKIEGEYAHSFYSPDKNAPPIPIYIVDPLNAIHKPNITTKKGNGFLLKTQFEKNRLKISAKARYLEPGYHTLGVYFMNRSRLMTEEKISYKLKTLPISASINHSLMENNNTDLNTAKSSFTRYNGTLTWSPKNLPIWNMNYTRYYYNTYSGNNIFGSNGKIIAVTASHNYSVKGITCASVVSLTEQKTTNTVAASDVKPTETFFYSLSAQQNIILNKGIVVSAGGTTNKTVALNNEFYQSFANASVLIPVAKKYQLEIFSRANFMNQSMYRMSEGVNIGMQFTKNFLFKIRSEYIHWLNNATNSIAGSAALTVQW